MGIDAKSQRIGDLEAALTETQINLRTAQDFGLKMEKEKDKLKDMVIILIDKDIYRTRCCE